MFGVIIVPASTPSHSVPMTDEAALYLICFFGFLALYWLGMTFYHLSKD